MIISASVESVGNYLSIVVVLEGAKDFRVFLKPYGYLQEPALLVEVL